MTSRQPTPPARRRGSVATRRRWAVAATGAIAVALIAVGLVVAVRDSPGAQLGRAIDATLEESTARASISGSVEELPVVGSVEVVVAEGDLDFAAQRARLEREVPVVSELGLPGIGDAGPLEIIFSDGGAWARVPFDTDRWVELRDPDGDPAAEDRREADVAPGIGNPLAVFALLRAVEARPDDVAVDEITVEDVEDGGSRFDVRVNLDAVEEVGGEGAEGFAAAARRITPDGTVPVTVAVDDAGRVSELRVDGVVDLAGITEVEVTSTMVLRDFGADVALDRPPEDHVLRWDQLPEIDVELPELDPLGALSEWLDDLPIP